MGITAKGCTDMRKSGTVELASSYKAFIRRAYEVASLVLRIDHLVTAKAITRVHKQ